MSYAPVSPASTPRRPTPVTVAAAIMTGIAALVLIFSIISLASLGRTRSRFRDIASRTDATPREINDLTNGITAAVIVIAVIGLLVSILLLALAAGNLRGRNGARVTTWIVCALGVLCGCCGVVGSIVQGTISLSIGGTDDSTGDQLGRALADAYPSWWLVLNGGLSGLQALGYIAVAALLAVPAANAFFRKAPAATPVAPPPGPAGPPPGTAWPPPAQPG